MLEPGSSVIGLGSLEARGGERLAIFVFGGKLEEMPDWLTVVLLGIVEGITEFLPISSTGHLLLVQNAGLLAAQSELFNVVIQSGAVVAVLAVFWRRTVTLATGLHDPKQRDYLIKLLVSFVLTGMGGVVLKAVGFELPETVGPVAAATFIGGLLILAAERKLAGRSPQDHITWTICIAVAAAQLLAAAFPGTSRSGACIVAAMLLGLNRSLAVEFSFLVGVPTLLAAGALEVTLSLVRGEAGNEDWGLVALGTAVSAVVAFIAVRWLLQFVRSNTLNVFGVYRIALTVVLVAYMLWAV